MERAMPAISGRPAETVDHITEALARAWIVCDPNRHPNDPDEMITMSGGKCHRWEWFVPRALAMRDFLSAQGLVIRPKETP